MSAFSLHQRILSDTDQAVCKGITDHQVLSFIRECQHIGAHTPQRSRGTRGTCCLTWKGCYRPWAMVFICPERSWETEGCKTPISLPLIPQRAHCSINNRMKWNVVIPLNMSAHSPLSVSLSSAQLPNFNTPGLPACPTGTGIKGGGCKDIQESRGSHLHGLVISVSIAAKGLFNRYKSRGTHKIRIFNYGISRNKIILFLWWNIKKTKFQSGIRTGGQVVVGGMREGGGMHVAECVTHVQETVIGYSFTKWNFLFLRCVCVYI